MHAGSGRGPNPMVSADAAEEIEQYLGHVPSFIEALPEEAADHGWAIMRDLQLEETEPSEREKALTGLGAAAAIQCPYCIHFHREEAKLADVTDDELNEAVSLASMVRYFSTVLHGTQIDVDEFADETASIVEHVEEQQVLADDD